MRAAQTTIIGLGDQIPLPLKIQRADAAAMTLLFAPDTDKWKKEIHPLPGTQPKNI